MSKARPEPQRSIENRVIRRFVDYWDAKRGDRPWPLRADIDPVDFVYALGYISLVEVRGDRFFFRLDGTKQVELFGVDCGWKYLDECFPADHIAMASASFSRALEGGMPQFHLREIGYQGRLMRYELAILPMSRDGTRADMLMTVIVPLEDR